MSRPCDELTSGQQMSTMQRTRSMHLANVRWWIAGLLSAATALAYVDRQTLSLVIGEIQKTIPVSDQQFGNLQFAFLLAYGIMYAGAGRITDVFGSRWGFFAIISWWSIASLIQGTVTSVIGLGVGLFLLGVGEGGCFPAGAKVISEWFSVKDRSLAFGVFNAGSGIGATLAPPFIAAVALLLNWRWVFLVTGVSGLIWAAVWVTFYRRPADDALRSSSGIHAQDRPLSATVEAEVPIAWLQLFRFRQTWGLVLARFLSDSAWFFLVFWLPKYLLDMRGFNMKSLGDYAWIPYAFATLGSLLGGWLSRHLIQKSVSVDRSRKICLAISAACLPFSALITVAPLSVCVGLFSLALFGHQWWSTLLQTVPADLYPSSSVGSVVGILGSAGAFGGMLFNPLAGTMLTHYHNYALVFRIVAMMHPCACALLLLIVGRIESVRLPHRSLPLPKIVFP